MPTAFPNAVTCALRGIEAVNPRTLVSTALPKLSISDTVHIISIGKAATTMAQGAIDALGDRISRGIVIAPTPASSTLPSTFTTFQGGHPIPNAEGARGAQAVLNLAESLQGDDTVLCLISGGASALTMLPPEGVSLDDVQSLTTLLLRAGATIDELNCVRKHIDRLKGGRLARAAAPAKVITLILSDVIGDPVDVIASGPTVPDPTTFADAIKVLHHRGIWEKLSPSVRAHFESAIDESPKPGDPAFTHATVEIIGNNTKAANATCECAELLGYSTSIVTTTLEGEARDRGIEIAKRAIALQREIASGEAPRCLIYAGETTVTVTGNGRGGRNQELVLSAAIALSGHKGITIASMGTDGIDGPTDAAGAFADGDVITRAQQLGYDAKQYLQNNDAYTFWNAVGGLVKIGPTGTNVMDLIVVTID
jgi:glycerate 2-kinase